MVRWLGMRWVGVPWPRRAAAWAMTGTWPRLPGCGCVYRIRMGVVYLRQWLLHGAALAAKWWRL